MKLNRIGVDPGCSGAIVVLSPDNIPLEWMIMPTMQIGKSSRVNGAEVAEMLRPFSSDSECYLERVGAMTGQGVTGMFNFGHATGTVTGVLMALGLKISLVEPRIWKKRAGLLGKDKDAARGLGIMTWPDWRDLDKKGKGQALADAAFIAMYGEKQF